MLEFKEALRALCGVFSASGCEREAGKRVAEMFGQYFDSVTVDRARNIILCKKSQRADASGRVMLDAHFDEVGMLVTGVTDEGLLRVTSVGGIDRNLLPASTVWVYPDAPDVPALFGVFMSERKDGAEPKWDNLLVDIGYPKEEAERLCPVGTPVGYGYSGEDLADGRITGRGFDDKSCAAGLICAAANTPADELAYDVYVTLSSGEETGADGARNAAREIKPDFAVITDVNFALTPGVDAKDGGKLGGGSMISLSAVTDRALTRDIIKLCKDNEIPYTTTVEPTSTGTNASCIMYEGVPCAVVSIPLAGMHSYNELLDIADGDSFVHLISLIIKGMGKGGRIDEQC